MGGYVKRYHSEPATESNQLKTTVRILLGIMLAAVATAQARKQGTAAQPKPKANAEQKGCTEARSAFVEKFSQLVSTFHDQVELAEVTPRIALAQRVAEIQKTAQELKSAAIPPCALASSFSAVAGDRIVAALEMEIAVFGASLESSAETMKEAVQKLQSSDNKIDATCQGLTKEKALNLRLEVWKSDANVAAKFEIKRFLLFMKSAYNEAGSRDKREAAAQGALYSVAAQSFWRTTADGTPRWHE
jgi:hypothetical protein